MKYCPYCGSALAGESASFCSECGKAVSMPGNRSNQSSDSHSSRSPRAKSTVRAENSNRGKQKRASIAAHFFGRSRRQDKPKRRTVTTLMPTNSADEGYDGYYDDIPTEDDGGSSGQLEPELVKRIALIAVGAIAIVILSISMMYLL